MLLDASAALLTPTELQYWDTTNAYSGYNFYGASGTSYLLDMDGRVVHTWPLGTNPHLLTAAEGYSGSAGDVLDFMNGSSPSGATGLEEVNWSGSVVWSYTNTRSNYYLHHDFERIYDPDLGEYTTIFIANKDYTYAQCVAAGANPSTTPSTGAQMDTITEVDQSGNIVWEWDFFDHLIQDQYPTEGNYAGTGETPANYPGKLDIDLPGHPLQDDWLHCNSLDFNQSLDEIVINSVQGEFYVINHGGTIVAGNPTASIAKAATSAGDFLYRFGDPARYGQGTTPSITGITSSQGTKQLGGAHDVQWIGAGLPGAGDFLIFNNAEYLSETTPQSYVEEINPYLNSSGVNTGSYVNPPDAGYNTVTSPAVDDKSPMLISKQVVWDWSRQSNLSMMENDIGGSAQRLPNGNTLICSDVWGYITEVTPSDKTVWDYIVPVVAGTGPVLTLGDRLPYDNSIFRAYCYASTDPTIAGYTLTPGATIAGRTTVSNPYAGTSNYEALQRATETQDWDPNNAYNGYTFFSAEGISYLIDMQGRMVHTWATGNDAKLLNNGDVLDWITDSYGNDIGLQELDWNSKVVWSYTETASNYHLHGDFERIFDPDLGEYTTLVLANKDETYAQLVAAGANPATTPSTGGQLDTILEIDNSGNIVWEWDFFDHLVQNLDATKANYETSISAYPGKLNINLTGIPITEDWLDCNSIDFNQSLDQIVVNSSQCEFYIISHGNTIVPGNPAASVAKAATTAGDFLYRFGDPARYGEGTSAAVLSNWEDSTTGDKQIGGSSDVTWIPAGLPGAGDLLVFDNNQYLFERSPYSFVFQVDPYMTSSGTDSTSYVDPPSAGYTTETFGANTMDANQPLSNQVVWKYNSQGYETLFSQWGSSAQRLPNGDTLICSTVNGYVVEVDPSGNVDWEYINPVTNSGIATALGDRLPMTNAVPRAVRYAASFSGFAGHTLTPGATIAGTIYPSIANTTLTPSSPTSSNAPYVTSSIADANGVSSATLTYTTGSGTGTTSTPFTETFGTTPTGAGQNWTGTADNTWTVVGTPDPFKLITSANYTTSSTACGLQFNCSKTATASITSGSINAAATTGYVTFYLQATSLSTGDGWALQVDPTGTGNNFATCLSGTANVTSFTEETYNFTSSQLTSSMLLRFLFTGTANSGDAGRINLDQITVSKTIGGTVTTTIPMYDDGLHGDGAAGDGVYGAQIPAQTSGTPVSYYITVTDANGMVSDDPSAAPASRYSYTVGSTTNSPPTVATPAAATPSTVTGTTTALSVLGADVDTGESNLTYTWTTTSIPTGATAPTYIANGTNAAKNTTATFSQAGSYTFQVTITDPGGLTCTSSVTVTVSQTLTAISVSPTSASVNISGTQQFTATAKDQFGTALTAQPTFTWTTTVTGGSVSYSGLFTAPSAAASGTVTATSSSVSGSSTVTVTSTPPTITGTTCTPASPTSSTAPYITSTITDLGTITSATLTYSYSSPVTTTPFSETFGTTPTTGTNLWTGASGQGQDQVWTVVATPNPFKLSTLANYVQPSSSACGLMFNSSKATTASITSTTINEAGTSGYVQFYVGASAVNTSDGWALQVDLTGTGNSFVTRLSGTASSTSFTQETYNFVSSELTSTELLRFVFTGTGQTTDSTKVFLDQIIVSLTSSGTTTNTTTMYDDGLHGDGAAGDHVYGAQIPAEAVGTTVSYYVTATDNAGLVSKDPATAPTNEYSYTVAAAVNHAPTVTTPAAATPSPVTGTTTALSVLGADVDTGESSLTYTWTTTSIPSGATAPTYGANGTNAAKNATATFSRAGSYTFQVTITDPGGLTCTSSVTVTVNQTLTAISVSPTSASLNAAGTQQFTATGKDQFGVALTAQPTFTWTTTVTGGSVSSSGLFTAPSSTASGTVTATSSSISGSSTVTVTSTFPTIANTAQSPVTASASSPVWITSTVTAPSAVTVSLVYNAGSGAVTVPMYDDGLHHDGAAGDYVYGAAIPALPVGTTVRYYIAATDSAGTTADPGASLQQVGYLYSYTVASSSLNVPTVLSIPGGTFIMGDHFNTVDPNHPSDETPLHSVTVSSFDIGEFDITDEQYCDYLNSALSQGIIQVVSGLVYGAGSTYGAGSNLDLYSETRQGQLALYATANPPLTTPYSGIVWNGSQFSVIAGDQQMPMVGVYWDGAAAYCNWLSTTEGFQGCYSYSDSTTPTWTCNFSATGYRLPTEAEWEYAANGGNTNPYYMYPWAGNANTNGTYANTLGSGSPYAQSATLNQTGQVYPWTTPVGFYNGSLQLQSQWGWTANSETSYQTSNAVNGYGLYDMAGDVWQWTNDWYAAGYYSVSPGSNPTGPTSGDTFGTPAIEYHTLRGGSWAQDDSDAALANRDPAFYRQPLNTTYASIGFRILLNTTSPAQPGAAVTTVTASLQSGQGVAADSSGNVYFSDAATNTIYEYSTAEQLTTFKSSNGGDYGLKVDARGNVVACQGVNGYGRVVAYNSQGTMTVLAAGYNDLNLNDPADLWIDPQGGIYVTDPGASPSQSTAAVYYISPDRTTVTQVITNLVQPTGISGNAAGTTLYVSDASTGVTYQYSISSGVVGTQTEFAAVAATAIDVDTQGDVYLATSSGVLVYNSSGTQIATFTMPATPVGLCFGGTNKRTLFVVTKNGLYSLALATQGETIDGAPTIAGTTRTITSPLSTDTEWVTSNVTDDGYLASVQLSYTIGGTGLPTTEFTETFASTPTANGSAWTGTGANNAWTVVDPTGDNYITQQTSANYGTGNACGLSFKGGDSSLSDTMVTTTNGINTGGTAATVQFYLECNSASTSEGWTFQVNAGSGWVTVVSETDDKHSWQFYNETLTSSELSSSMLMRFQFEGNGSTDNVNLDDITVATTFGVTTVVPMYDDGQHHDGIAGDSVYGAEIPPQATGTTVCYHIIATDNTGLVSADPAASPFYYSYIVGQAATTIQFNELMSNPTTLTATTDYSTATVGVISTSRVGTVTASGADAGYTLIAPLLGNDTYLVNSQGQVVNEWVSSYNPGRSAYLLPNGDLIRSGSLPNAAVNTGGGEGGIIQEFAWNGSLIGQFTYNGTDTENGVSGLGYVQHHDFLVMPNGNILMIVVQDYTETQAIAAGFNPSLFDSNITSEGLIQIDGLVEVTPNWSSDSYTVVWQWSFWNHLVQNYNSSGCTFYTNSSGQTVDVPDYQSTITDPYLLNANCGAHTIQFYNHANGIDYNAALNQIVISARNQCEIYIIDASTTTYQAATETGGTYGHGGDFLYRWGNVANYGGTGAETLFQQHNAQWIASSLPGGSVTNGNGVVCNDILIFDDGDNRTPQYSSVDEITPPITAAGTYTLSANGTYGPTSDTWEWQDNPTTAFYNGDVGGCQRLPNGDTLICFGNIGLAFEVNAAGAIDWQYQDGDDGLAAGSGGNDGRLYQGDSLPLDPNNPAGGALDAMFRAPWYSAAYVQAASGETTLATSATIEKDRDWFEIYNSGTSAVSLGGMYLTTSASNPTMYEIPAADNVSVPAGGYLVFYADGETSSTTAPGRHTSFTLSPSGGSIYLYNVNGTTLVDSVTYPALAASVSYGRDPDGSSTWTTLSSPSPGWSNVPAAPSSVTLSSTTVADNQAAGATVGMFTSTDANPFDTFTYSLVSGTGSSGNSSFTIVGNTLETAVILNEEVQNSYSIRVRSTDEDGLYAEQVFTITVTHTNVPPVIAKTCLASAPSPGQAVLVDSTVTDRQGLTSVNLVYYNESQPTVSYPFTETFGTTATGAGQNWSGGAGTGTDNLWTVVGAPVPFKLMTAANYQTSSTACGVQFQCKTTTTATITTTNSINFSGTAATVSFWVDTINQQSSDSWAMELGSGSTFTTCISETDSSHAFQQYTYNLTSGQLTSGLYLRFAFTGTGTGSSDTSGDLINLDQIAVTVTGSSTAVTVPMSLSNGVYSADVPAEATGTQIGYYISATDSIGLTTTDPATAPAVLYSYTVQTSQATGLAFNTSPASGTYGGSISLAATLTANSTALANETITFSLNGTSVGTATTNSSGIATLLGVSLSGINAGSYSSYVGAAFAGDFGNNNYAASSTTENLAISQVAPAISLSASSNPAIYGQAVTFTATISSTAGTPSGTVTFEDAGKALPGNSTVTLSGSTASFSISTLALGSHTITAVYSGDTNFTAETTATLNETVVDTGPTVIGVYAEGVAWNSSFLDFLAANALGSVSNGLLLQDGATQLSNAAELTWSNINQISVTFDESVNVSQNSLQLINSSGTDMAMASSGAFSYDSSDDTAQWTFANSLPSDKYLVYLEASTITDSASMVLDGAWTTSSSTWAAGSGDGVPGSDFDYQFNLLVGDAGNRGAVTNGDLLLLRSQIGGSVNASNYHDDINASGSITNSDLLLLRQQIGSSISSFPNPVAPADSSSAQPLSSPDLSLSATTATTATVLAATGATSVTGVDPAGSNSATATPPVTDNSAPVDPVTSSSPQAAISALTGAMLVMPTTIAVTTTDANIVAGATTIVSVPAVSAATSAASVTGVDPAGSDSARATPPVTDNSAPVDSVTSSSSQATISVSTGATLVMPTTTTVTTTDANILAAVAASAQPATASVPPPTAIAPSPTGSATASGAPITATPIIDTSTSVVMVPAQCDVVTASGSSSKPAGLPGPDSPIEVVAAPPSAPGSASVALDIAAPTPIANVSLDALVLPAAGAPPLVTTVTDVSTSPAVVPAAPNHVTDGGSPGALLSQIRANSLPAKGKNSSPQRPATRVAGVITRAPNVSPMRSMPAAAADLANASVPTTNLLPSASPATAADILFTILADRQPPPSAMLVGRGAPDRVANVLRAFDQVFEEPSQFDPLGLGGDGVLSLGDLPLAGHTGAPTGRPERADPRFVISAKT